MICTPSKQFKNNAELSSEPLELFLLCSKSILTDFFEERSADVVSGMLEKWIENDQKRIEVNQKLKTTSLQRLASIFKRGFELPSIDHCFEILKKNAGMTLQQTYEFQVYEEKEKRIIAEASLSALQVELKEALERVKLLEKKEKKRKTRKERKKNRDNKMLNENCRSLTIEETPIKEIIEVEQQQQHPLLDADETKHKLEEILESHKKARRTAFPPDQRGSVNTEMRHRRLQNRVFTNRGSVAVSSVYSQARTEFSFHPSINQSSKWKLKYDDHHNHKKMWSRMHKEDERKRRKLRLKSNQKEREELSQCTFTPELFTRKESERNEPRKHKPQDVKQLSLRLYQYADLFKEKKEQLKDKLESERGQEMRFTPKISSVRSDKLLKTVKERDYPSEISLLTVKKPG